MPAWPRLAVLVAAAGLATSGLVLGAISQHEVFLESDLSAAEAAAEGADSNLIPLTAVPFALGVAWLAALLSRRPIAQRLLPVVGVALGAYGLLNLAQGAWPNYNAYVEARTADLSNTLLLANLEAAPSVVLPILAVFSGLLALVFAAARRLLAGPAMPDTPASCLHRHLGHAALVTPFLVVAALGNLQLLLALPGTTRGGGPYLVVLPVCIALALALLAVHAARLWQLGVWRRNARLGSAVLDAWLALGRVEAALTITLVAVAAAAGFLARIDLEALHLGRTFTVTLRSHTQFLGFLAFVLLPGLFLHRRTKTALLEAHHHGLSLESGPHPLAILGICAMGLALALAAVASLASDGALWPWAAAALPLTLLSALTGRPRDAAQAALLLAFTLWALGNTVTATYDGNQEGVLRFDESPGVLALWRTVAVLVAGATLARLVRSTPDAATANVTVRLLAVGAATCAGLVAILQMPLWAWLTPRAGTDALAVGSLLASFDPAVRATLNGISFALAAVGALLWARLQRPEWFRVRRPASPAVVRLKRRASA